MVTISHHQVGQIALMPLVEEAGIVVLCLAATPHVKRLIHDDQSHRVAHIQQFRCWRVMRRTDGVDTHLLQLRQLAVQGILAQRSSQTPEVVMFANAVEFEVLTVKPEAGLGIELEIAETRSGLHLVDHLAADQQLCP